MTGDHLWPMVEIPLTDGMGVHVAALAALAGLVALTGWIGHGRALRAGAGSTVRLAGLLGAIAAVMLAAFYTVVRANRVTDPADLSEFVGGVMWAFLMVALASPLLFGSVLVAAVALGLGLGAAVAVLRSRG